MLRYFLFILALWVFVGLSAQVKAEIFVWQDPVTKMSLSFPEEWRPQSLDNQEERLFILHPQAHDMASCTVLAHEDRRAMMIPTAHDFDVMKDVFSNENLIDALLARGIQNPSIEQRIDNAGFGPQPAVIVSVNYALENGSQPFPMHALIFSTLDKGYNMSLMCAAYRPRFEAYRSTFVNIAKSVDFPNGNAPFPNGLYRRFQDEGYVYLLEGSQKEGISRY